MKISTMTFFTCLLALNFGVANAWNTNSVSIPIEKVLKTFGVSNLEKVLLKDAKYRYSGGKLVAQRNNTFFPHIKDGQGRTNIKRMEEGLAPIGKDGKAVELHHLKQKKNGMVVELTNREHKQNSKILHSYRQQTQINRNEFNRFKINYWKERARELN